MAALTPISGRKLKAMLEADAYAVMHEDDYTWTMYRPGAEILDVPKLGDVMAMEIMYSLLHKAQINDRKYFDLLARVSS